MKITLEVDMNNHQDTQALISAIQELLRNIQKCDESQFDEPKKDIVGEM